MNALKTLTSTVSNFIADRSGNFGLMFAAASTGIVLSAGFAIDVTQMYSAKAELRQALDAAIVSTALDISRNKVSEADAKPRLELFFRANLNSKRFNSTTTLLTNVKVDAVTNIISASATTDYALAFPVFGSDTTKKIGTSSAGQYRQRLVEVSMVLDVTGSMAGQKIIDLKTAAKAGVKAFLDNGYGNARVAIVPYSLSVNAGSLSKYVVDEAGLPIKDTCSTERRGPEMFTDVGPTVAKVTRANALKVCPKSDVQPLTNSSISLNKTIDDLEAVGSTAGQIGLQWGAYMLSPKWKSVLPATATPAAYGTPELDKFLILMTDGQFNTDYSGLTNAQIASYSGIGARSGRLAMSYCNEIKAKKIKLFTIGFRLADIKPALDRNEATRLLQDCASTPVGTETTFFNADNGVELTAAFEEIAKRVEHVALVN